MVRHAPIHRRSDHSDMAICCGRNVRASSLCTSVVPLSNQVTTLNHKRFKGFKMFSDGRLEIARGRKEPRFMAHFAQHSYSRPEMCPPRGGKSPFGFCRLSTRGRYWTRARVVASSLAPQRACLTDKRWIVGISLATGESESPPIRLAKT